MMSGGWADATPRDEMRQRIRDLEASLAAANERAERLAADLAKERETWTDESGTVWNRPTAWAYQQVCRALCRSEAELVEARKDVARMEGAL